MEEQGHRGCGIYPGSLVARQECSLDQSPVNPRVMGFQEMLLEVQKSLGQDEVLDLVFLCTDLLRKDLSRVDTATELFSLLQKEDLLSSNDTTLLQELLTITRQKSLLQKLCLQCSQLSVCHISMYRRLLFELAENISEDNLRDIKFLLFKTLPPKILDKDLTMLQLFREMEKGGHLAADNLDTIERIIVRVVPYLKSTISQFKENSGAGTSPQETPWENRTSFQDFSVTKRPVQPETIHQNMNTAFTAEQGLESAEMLCPPSFLSSHQSEIPTLVSSFSGDNVEGQIANLSINDTSNQAQSHHGRSTEEVSMSSFDPYQQSTSEVEKYTMTGNWRGFCMIVNNYDFSNSPIKLNYRGGTDTDEKRLLKVFKWLGFTTEVVRDCSRERMLKALQDLKSRDHGEADCVVCCVLSHGYEGGVYGVDGGKVKLKELMEPLDGYHCPTLIDKPKIFFIQACRGIERQRVVFLQSDSESNSMEPELFSDAIVPRESVPAGADFLMSMATVPNFVSYRETVNGTWFIQTLCKSLEQLVPRGTDLMSILTQVNNEVSKKTSRSGLEKQMPQPEFTLRKLIIFPVPSDISTSSLI
ncbi:caspase-8 isoform X1 [Astyanax mexicanus]|uniref:caspase-8 isoform X1 n=1 Tax=Astyanax mexicanus TaxID=7994 RepID=UPI0020CB12A5|nr:caspase-8 isoform X1 [Astyanax mexicanus]